MASSPNPPGGPPSRWVRRYRRDGARLLSSALVLSGAGLVRVDHPLGQLVFVLAGLVSLFWWRQYRRLSV